MKRVELIERLAAACGAELVLRPMVLGVVFSATGNAMPASVRPKAASMPPLRRRSALALSAGGPERL